MPRKLAPPLMAAHIHRDGSSVVVMLRGHRGPWAPCRLTSLEARAVAQALNDTAADIEAHNPAESKIGLGFKISAEMVAPEPRIYRIVRYFERDQSPVRRHRLLTLAEAKAHCKDPESSSQTAQGAPEQLLTDRFGPWFDAYEVHPDFPTPPNTKEL